MPKDWLLSEDNNFFLMLQALVAGKASCGLGRANDWGLKRK